MNKYEFHIFQSLGPDIKLVCPYDTNLASSEVAGEHPLTPLIVQKFYSDNVQDNRLLTWKGSEGLLGFKEGRCELTLQTDHIKELALWFARPAKGSGYIYLLVSPLNQKNNEMVIYARYYDHELLAWFRKLKELLSSFLPLEIQEKDMGYDA